MNRSLKIKLRCFFHPVAHEFITETWLVYLRIFGSTPFKATAATQVTAAFSTAFGIKILSIILKMNVAFSSEKLTLNVHSA